MYSTVFFVLDGTVGLHCTLTWLCTAKVGLAACQVGKALGLTVVGTAGTADGEKLVRDVGGADFVFNHKSNTYLSDMQVLSSTSA